jgi:hypothetical protein
VLFTRLTDSTANPKRKQDATSPTANKKPGRGMILELDSIGNLPSKSQKSINDISPDQIKSIRMVKSDDQVVLPPELMEVFIIQAGKKQQHGVRSGVGDSSKAGLQVQSLSLSGKEFDPDATDRNPQINKFNQTSNTSTPNINIRSLNSIQPVLGMLADNKTLNDSIPLPDLERVFRSNLSTEQQSIHFALVARQWNRSELPRIDHPRDTLIHADDRIQEAVHLPDPDSTSEELSVAEDELADIQFRTDHHADGVDIHFHLSHITPPASTGANEERLHQ